MSDKVKVRYEETKALYASQFVINATEEELIINFSSGSLPDPMTGENHLPVHSRVAISISGAKRLVMLLNQALSASQANSDVTAKLPSLFESVSK